MMQHYAMLQRNLLYTAVTRGKRLVVLVGQKRAVAGQHRTQSGSSQHRIDQFGLAMALSVDPIGRVNWNSAPFLPSDDAVS